MLTTRGAVARLSRRAASSAKKTNAFFSTAALAQRVNVPSSSSSRAPSSRPQSASAST
ncbi:atp2, beta subunit of the F1 sector of mitochondrial F1F0 ATP synthase, partial [Marasmius sp. AFHP31]